MIKLGDMVKEKVTGFVGIAVSKTEWLHGCVRWGVQSKGLHEGKPVDVQWFDEGALEVVPETPPCEPEMALKKNTGGPRDVETGHHKDPIR